MLQYDLGMLGSQIGSCVMCWFCRVAAHHTRYDQNH